MKAPIRAVAADEMPPPDAAWLMARHIVAVE
jgi:hypothetical protein